MTRATDTEVTTIKGRRTISQNINNNQQDRLQLVNLTEEYVSTVGNIIGVMNARTTLTLKSEKEAEWVLFYLFDEKSSFEGVQVNETQRLLQKSWKPSPKSVSKQFGQTEEVSNVSLEEKEEPGLVAVGEQVVLQTARVDLVNPKDDNKKEETRLLLDSGSQRSYISRELADKMELKPSRKNYLTLYTFGSTNPKRIETSVVDIGIIQKSGFIINIKANVVPHVTGSIERKPIETVSIRKKIEGYDLADSLPLEPENFTLHLLIGNDYYADIVSMKRITICNGLYLLGSKFGWILSGRAQTEVGTTDSMMMLTNTSSELATQYLDFIKEDEFMTKEPNLEEFWKLETIGITDSPTITDDEKAVSEFYKSIKLVDGRYSWFAMERGES